MEHSITSFTLTPDHWVAIQLAKKTVWWPFRCLLKRIFRRISSVKSSWFRPWFRRSKITYWIATQYCTSWVGLTQILVGPLPGSKKDALCLVLLGLIRNWQNRLSSGGTSSKSTQSKYPTRWATLYCTSFGGLPLPFPPLFLFCPDHVLATHPLCHLCMVWGVAPLN